MRNELTAEEREHALQLLARELGCHPDELAGVKVIRDDDTETVTISAGQIIAWVAIAFSQIVLLAAYGRIALWLAVTVAVLLLLRTSARRYLSRKTLRLG